MTRKKPRPKVFLRTKRSKKNFGKDKRKLKNGTFHIDLQMSANQLVEICGVHERTARRWCAGEQDISGGYERLVNLYRSGKVIQHKRIIAGPDGFYVDGYGSQFISYDDLSTMWIKTQQVDRLEWKVKQIEKIKNALQSQVQDYAAQDTTKPTMIVKMADEGD